ncbi:hypothetical protein ACWATR_37835 [Nostoc sp. UIC 10890]
MKLILASIVQRTCKALTAIAVLNVGIAGYADIGIKAAKIKHSIWISL